MGSRHRSRAGLKSAGDTSPLNSLQPPGPRPRREAPQPPRVQACAPRRPREAPQGMCAPAAPSCSLGPQQRPGQGRTQAPGQAGGPAAERSVCRKWALPLSPAGPACRSPAGALPGRPAPGWGPSRPPVPGICGRREGVQSSNSAQTPPDPGHLLPSPRQARPRSSSPPALQLWKQAGVRQRWDSNPGLGRPRPEPLTTASGGWRGRRGREGSDFTAGAVGSEGGHGGDGEFQTPKSSLGPGTVPAHPTTGPGHHPQTHGQWRPPAGEGALGRRWVRDPDRQRALGQRD